LAKKREDLRQRSCKNGSSLNLKFPVLTDFRVSVMKTRHI